MIRLAAKVSPRAPEKSEPRRLKFLDEVPATDYQNSGFEPCRLRGFCITKTVRTITYSLGPDTAQVD